MNGEDRRPGQRARRGQFEIMGLAVIVILVMLGILFYLSTTGGSDTSLKATFSQKRMAVDFIKASLDTQTTACGAKATLRELLQDCATRGPIMCSGKTSCEFLKGTYASLLTSTFMAINQRFYFEVLGSGESLSTCNPTEKKLCSISQGNVGTPKPENFAATPRSCQGEKEIASQPLPTRAGTINIKLEICGKTA